MKTIIKQRMLKIAILALATLLLIGGYHFLDTTKNPRKGLAKLWEDRGFCQTKDETFCKIEKKRCVPKYSQQLSEPPTDEDIYVFAMCIARRENKEYQNCKNLTVAWGKPICNT